MPGRAAADDRAGAARLIAARAGLGVRQRLGCVAHPVQALKSRGNLVALQERVELYRAPRETALSARDPCTTC